MNRAEVRIRSGLYLEKGDDDIKEKAEDERTYRGITVSYTKRSLPDHDLAKGADPLPRYPGAVMIGYHKSSLTMQGLTSTEINADYLAPDTTHRFRET